MMAQSLGMKLRRLQSGLIGMGTPGVEQGDKVAVPKGSLVAFVLRKTEDHHRLFGQVYVSEMMKYGLSKHDMLPNLHSQVITFSIR
jgi:hypothetical protein